MRIRCTTRTSLDRYKIFTVVNTRVDRITKSLLPRLSPSVSLGGTDDFLGPILGFCGVGGRIGPSGVAVGTLTLTLLGRICYVWWLASQCLRLLGIPT